MGKFPYTPRMVTDMAREDPYVGRCLEFWLNGEITWEQVLIMMVLELSKEKQRLMRDAQVHITGGPIVIPEGLINPTPLEVHDHDWNYYNDRDLGPIKVCIDPDCHEKRKVS